MHNKPLIYLASPYTHPDPAIMRSRFVEVCKVAAYLTEYGFLIYSPIAETVPLKEQGGFRGSTWQDWKDRDEAILEHCDELWVCPLDGWKESVGVQAEIEYMRALGKPTKILRASPWSRPYWNAMPLIPADWE